MKNQDQRIRELERELVVLQLCRADVIRAIKERGESPELRSAFARLFEKRVAAVAEWRRLMVPALSLIFTAAVERTGGARDEANRESAAS